MSEACWGLFGLNVLSELALPFPEEPVSPARESVRVAFAPLAPQGHWITTSEPNDLQLEIPDVARFRIIAGQEILIDPSPGVSDRNLRVYLLGSAFGALLHQRGLLPLHANAVVVKGQAVAFMGASGAGKSSLAVWFQDHGYSILADDLCAVSCGQAEPPQVLPGVPRLRLWKDAVARSGRESDELELSFDGQDKFDLPAPRNAIASPAPLAGCYLLGEPEAARAPRITRLAGAEAIEALIANTYRGKFLKLVGSAERHFEACLEVNRSVPVYRVERVKAVEDFESVARMLEDHVQTLVGQALEPLALRRK